jgi:CBS domain-containing protein
VQCQSKVLYVTELPRPEPQRTRSSCLLDGRRVTINDLLEAGLLAAGDELTFTRTRLDETHRATVTATGKLTLEDGQEFPSPSRAAMAATGSRAIDGWRAWKVSPDTLLDALRQQLLEQAAKGTANTADESPTARWNGQRRYELLNEARTDAESDKPVELLVRDLFVRWGESSDGGSNVYQRIEADLANHGLTTVPNFRKVSLDTPVRIVIPAQDETDSQSPVSSGAEEDELDAGLTVGNIPSALGGVDSVPPDASFEQAITLMLLNGYSQLAVLSGLRNLRGAVTWQSIAYTRHANPNARFRDAIIDARAVRYDQALIEVLPDIETMDFVFVQDETNVVKGIVTVADVVGTFRELSTPFILIGELDQVLRQIISRTFTLEEITSVCNREGRREITSFDDLEMGDYQSILGNPDRWSQLGWPQLDRATIVKRLDELRVIRNNVMHFNPEPVPSNTVGRLRNILKLLRDFGGPAAP